MRNPFGFEFYPGRRLPVVCRDGVTRSAVCTGYASQGLPAAVQIYSGGKRRTVSGTVYNTGKRLPATPTLLRQLGLPAFELSFHATGANAALIPWTAHKPRLARAALRLIKATAYGRGAPGYIWDSGADHAAALAAACRAWATAAFSAPHLGCQATAVFRRLPPAILPHLAVFFDKQAAFIRMEESRPVPPPRDLPA